MDTTTTRTISNYTSSTSTSPAAPPAASGSPATAQGRRLACCIPVRGGGGTGRPVEVMLVSSRRCACRQRSDKDAGQSNMVFPKGGWEPDESLFQAAEREAFEEAGVSGRLETPHVEEFQYESLKDRPDKGGHTRARTVYVFVLDVMTEHAEWPEKDSRTRVWVQAASVRGLLKHEWMKEVFDGLCTERGWL